MTALIRGASETDPSKAQRRSDTAVNTPLGGETALGLAALKATSHSPSGQSTNNSVSHKDPSRLSLSLPSIAPRCLFIRVFKVLRSFGTHPERHPHENNQSGFRFINHILVKNESKTAPASSRHQMGKNGGNGPNGFQNYFLKGRLLRKKKKKSSWML